MLLFHQKQHPLVLARSTPRVAGGGGKTHSPASLSTDRLMDLIQSNRLGHLRIGGEIPIDGVCPSVQRRGVVLG